MKREIIRVEPLASYLEKYKAPTSTVTRHGDTIYVTGVRRSNPTRERSASVQSNARQSSRGNS
jgi:2-iminobutanoate/2-iminopropanoate deaminase